MGFHLRLDLSLGSLPMSGDVPAPAVPEFNTIVIEGDSQTRTMLHPNEGEADTADFFSTLWKASRPDKTVHIRAVSSRVVGTAAELNDNGNSLFGNVAEDAAYGPDLTTYMIGSNDLGSSLGTAEPDYRTNLIALYAARKAAQPNVKIAWSPPPPYNSTGTPNPGKVYFDPNHAALMADARNPAVWGQWADYYIPLGEHPDFNDPALHPTVFADSVHASAAGHSRWFDVYSAAMDTLLDPTRVNSGTLYDGAWLNDETDLAVGETITRRMIVSGLAWTGHAGGVSVTGGGSPSVKVNGLTPSGRVYNGDVVDLTLTLSASHETAVTPSLTIGGETRALSYTTAADLAPAAYVHGDVTGEGGGDATLSLTGLTFSDGRAVVMIRTADTAQSTTVFSTAPTLDSVALTFRRREYATGTGGIEIWEGPVTAGNSHAIAVTYPAWTANRVVSYGTVTGGAFLSATGNAPADESNPHLTPSVTVPANGIAVAGFLEYGGAPLTPATANSPTTLIDEGNRDTFGEAHGIAVGTRTTTGSASFNFTFGSFPRVIAVYEAA